MAEKTAPLTPDPSHATAPAAVPVATPAPETAPRAARMVTLPVLPLAIVGAVLVAVVFFGGGVAVGFAVGDHPTRVGVIQPFNNGREGTQGGQNGFGQNPGQNGGRNGFGQNNGQNNGTRPNDRPTTAPKNG